MSIEKTKANPHIRIVDLRVDYEGMEALKGISLDVPDRQITAIMGSSGCGKTTLLKSINRLVELGGNVKMSGSVLVDGVDILLGNGIVDLMELRRKIGYIAQTPNPLPMSIFDNIAYGPRIHGEYDKVRLSEVVEGCLRSAGLWDEVKERLNSPATALSVGQQQRLCLARALAVEPEVLLCDDPTSSLDPISADHIERKLKELSKDYTVVFVTHTLRQARRIADYVVFMHMGELVEHGKAEHVFNHPQDQRTRDFINGVFG